MQLYKIMRNQLHSVQQPQTLVIAQQCLLRGEVIALPTDTVYGLACDANNKKALQKLYSIKGRDSQKPVAICVHDVDALRRYGHTEHLQENFLKELLPGPITIVVERTPQLSNSLLNPNTTRIGIRIPNFPFMRELCSLYKEQPLALTSANISNEPSSLQVQEFAKLWPKLGAICDAGYLGLNAQQRDASTVVDLTKPGYYKILRPGMALKSTLKILQQYDLHQDV